MKILLHLSPFLLSFLFLNQSLLAQDYPVVRCHTVEAEQARRAQNPEMETIDQFEKWMNKTMDVNRSSVITTIPVVFHIIHNNSSVGSGTNISSTYISAQLSQLNNDFRKISGTSGDNNNSVGADSEIEFCLAAVDPSGNAISEPGINRINRVSKGWTAPPYGTCPGGQFNDAYIENTIKPQSQWNPNDYMNIWLMDINCGILGYAQFPNSSGLSGLGSSNGNANTDGVVLIYSSVGSTVTPYPGAAPYNKGRTATHEVGHFLGLRHIWGDTNCGTDYCNDTPTQETSSGGCPNTTTCDGQNDMVENYMDYSDDSCMNIFTNNQKSRMQTVLSNSPRRGSLGNSSACSSGSGNSCSTTISSFPYTETFESGLGAWSNGGGDSFDWTRDSGSTPSGSTGPSSASNGSFYIFMESSSPNYSNKRAIITGPCLNFAGAPTASVSFKYHNYGASAMGSLDFQVSTNGSNWSTVWTVSGNQGNSWKTATLNLNSYAGQTIYIRFNGITGTTWQGDMAIDNFVVTTTTGGGGSSCSSTVNTSNYSEGFESSFGLWTQGSGDDTNWTRRSGSTPSGSTGPSSATEGSFYAYVEASSPNYPSKKAFLDSPCINFDGLGNKIVNFKYHMYGSNMGTLLLRASTNNGVSWTTAWSESGNQGNSWQDATVNLGSYSGVVKLRFDYTTGSSYRGDCAIDAFSIGSTSGGGSSCEDINVSITFDDYPEETSWQITNGSNAVVASGNNYGSQGDGSTINIPACLPNGCYTFTIFDTYGDGICCSYGNGSYTVTNGSNQVVVSGGSFGSSESSNFCLSNASREISIDQLEKEIVIKVFPNPSSGLFNVELISEVNDEEASLMLYNLLGELVFAKAEKSERGMNSYHIDLSEMSAGTYVLNVRVGSQMRTERLVIYR